MNEATFHKIVSLTSATSCEIVRLSIPDRPWLYKITVSGIDEKTRETLESIFNEFSNAFMYFSVEIGEGERSI